MSKSKTKKDVSLNDMLDDKKEVKNTTVFLSHAVFAFKNGGGVKVLVETAEKGQALLQDVLSSLEKNKPYFNAERGLLLNPEEISHIYLTQEKAQ